MSSNIFKSLILSSIPLLIYVDDFKSSIILAILTLSSTIVTTFLLLIFKNFQNRAKYLISVILSTLFNYMIYYEFLVLKYNMCIYSDIIVYISSFSMIAILFDIERYYFSSFLDFMFNLSKVCLVNLFMYVTYGILVYLFNEKFYNLNIVFFSYPASAMIFSVVYILMIKKFFYSKG